MRLVKKGFVLWFTGLSGAGKSTLSALVARRLAEAGCPVELLDGDEVRTHLSKGLGFSREDRDVNVRRIGFVARLLARHGVIAITAAISPYRDVREEQRRLILGDGAGFCEVYMECPVEVLAERDVKGLYRKALAGEIPHFTGVSDPYEPPEHPDVVIRSDRDTVEQGLERVLARLVELDLLASEVMHARASAGSPGVPGVAVVEED
jgi:adenylyl-sulfate kinase